MEAQIWGFLTEWGDRGLFIAIVTIIFWMIASGRLVTRRERDAIERDRDYWREAHTISEGTRGIMAQQIEKLVASSEVTNQVVQSLKRAVDVE